jgi:hypothetical protein
MERREVICLNGKNFLLAIFLSSMILALAFCLNVGSQTTVQYDPWADINDDGKIDIKDIAYSSMRFGTLGDPIKNVSVTNWPIATNYLTVTLNVSGSGGALPNFLSANETANIGGKSVTFTGGGVSGGVSFSNYGQDSLGGGTSGSGRIEVYDTGGNLIASFALPLNSMITVNKVGTIKVYAEAVLPYLGLPGTYRAFVVASVFWIQN